MSFNSKEQSPSKPGLTINESMRKSLMGLPSHPRRTEQILLAQNAAEKFDFKIIESLGLSVNQERLNTVSPEVIKEFVISLEEVPQDEIVTSLQEALQQYNDVEVRNNFQFPKEIVGLKLASLFLILLMVGAFFIPDRAYGAAALPTVTPTVSEVLPTVTPSKQSDTENLTPTATPSKTVIPTLQPTRTPTPEATATPEIIKEYAVILQDGTNLRPDASTTQDPVYKADAGEQFELTGKKTVVGTHTWYEVFIAQDLTDENKSTKAWVRGDLVTIEKQTIPSNEQSPEKRGIGDSLSDEELLAQAREFFTTTVTIEFAPESTQPIAKIDKYVVGEFVNGEWQHLREIQVLSEEELSYYPNLTEKKVQERRVLVQNELSKEIIVAEWSETEKAWIRPTKTAYELTLIAQDLAIETKKVSRNAAEAQENLAATPYEYTISARPDIEEGQRQERRSLVIQGVINQGPQILELPIQQADDQEWINTSWKLRVIVLPVSSVDANGRWYTDNIAVEAAEPLVKGDQIFWPTFLGEKYTEDITTYSKLPNGFTENSIYLNSLPVKAAKDLDLPDGSPVALYVYDLTEEDSEEYRAQTVSLLEIFNNFNFDSTQTPNQDQIDFSGILLLRGQMPNFRVPGIDVLNDKLIQELIEDGSNSELNFYGGPAAVQKIVKE